MEIKFDIPCIDFDPLSINNGFLKIPNKPGIYIWGYWIWIHGEKTFCPMYVGETGKELGTLRKRLMTHYCTHFEIKDNGTAAFFEINKYMTQENIDLLYEQLGVYNDLPKENDSRLESIKKLKKNNGLSRLIFYQNKGFFDFEIPQKEKNIGLYSLIEFLSVKNTKGVLEHGELLNKIIERQEVHSKNFFCIYATLENEIDNSKRKVIENTVNKVLRDKLGIATIAKRENKFDIDLKINFNNVKDLLVKTKKQKNCLKKDGRYLNNLTISIN